MKTTALPLSILTAAALALGGLVTTPAAQAEGGHGRDRGIVSVHSRYDHGRHHRADRYGHKRGVYKKHRRHHKRHDSGHHYGHYRGHDRGHRYGHDRHYRPYYRHSYRGHGDYGGVGSIGLSLHYLFDD